MKTNLLKFLTLSFMIMFQWSFAQKSISSIKPIFYRYQNTHKLKCTLLL